MATEGFGHEIKADWLTWKTKSISWLRRGKKKKEKKNPNGL